jgi:(S)-citramalyl-CoA lyase
MKARSGDIFVMVDTPLSATRSWLFTPATRPDRFPTAAASGADVTILDLEDSVALGDKDRARETALGFLLAAKPGRIRHALRINGLDTQAGLRDLTAVLGPRRCPISSSCRRPRPPAIC